MAANVSAETIKATKLAGGKRMAGVRQGLDRTKAYAVEEAVAGPRSARRDAERLTIQMLCRGARHWKIASCFRRDRRCSRGNSVRSPTTCCATRPT